MNHIPSYVFRRMAMNAIKPAMSVLIIAALLVSLPGLISLTVSTLTGALPDIYLESPIKRIDKFIEEADPELPEEELTAQAESLLDAVYEALKTFWHEKGVIFAGMTALELLLTPALGIVLTWSLLMAARKKELTMASLLTPLRWCPKALVVELWMFLRILVWMLPGMAVMVVGARISGRFGAILTSAGSITATVLSIRALLHYSLATVALAADPARSPNACIRASWEVMRNHKMDLFMLELSFIGWELLLSIFGSMLGILGTLGTALTMVLSLALSVYRMGAQVCFYELHTTALEAAQRYAAKQNAAQDDAPQQDAADDPSWDSREL